MIVVNFATSQYKRGQQRLASSLDGVKKLMLDNYVVIKSPTHTQSPYEFKLHAMWHAAKFDNIVLWCDSSFWLVGDLSKIETIIQTDGYFFEEAGHYAGRWTNEHTRKYFKVTNEEMFEGPGGITMFSAGLVGLDFHKPLARDFFEQWKTSAKAGCFRGHYSDHRHDQTAGSIIATRLGMKYQRGGKHMSYIGDGYPNPEPETVFYLQGL